MLRFIKHSLTGQKLHLSSFKEEKGDKLVVFELQGKFGMN